MPLYLANRLSFWTRALTSCSYPRDVPLLWAAIRRRRPFEIPDGVWSRIVPIMQHRGLIARQDAGLLYWAAKEWPLAGPVLELGSFQGASTAVFALAGRHVHAVDAWSLDVADISAYRGEGMSADDVFDRFCHNVEALGISHLVTVHRGLTHDVGRVWATAGAILFVDAGHTYGDVKGDLEIWTPHLHPDGLLIMHDVLNGWRPAPGVTRAASELLRNGWRVVASAGSIVAFVRMRRDMGAHD